jgi:hypothetical protein
LDCGGAIDLPESDEEEEIEAGGPTGPHSPAAAAAQATAAEAGNKAVGATGGQASRASRATPFVMKKLVIRVGQNSSAIYPPAAPSSGAAHAAAVETAVGTDSRATVNDGIRVEQQARTAVAAEGGLGYGVAVEPNAGAAGGLSTAGTGVGGGREDNTVEVSSRDLHTLEYGEFVNDNVMDFYIKKLQ